VIPIVDIFTLSYNISDSAFKDKQAQAHMYRLLAEQNGWKVRNSSIVHVKETFSEDGTEVEELAYGDTNKFNDVTLKEAAALLGCDINRDLKEDQQELNDEMFSRVREVYKYTDSNGNTSYVNDTLVNRQGKKWYIRQLLSTNGKTFAVLETSKGDVITIDANIIASDYSNKVNENYVYTPIESAIRFHDGNRRLFSMVSLKKPTGKKENMFNPKKNKRLALQMKMAKVLAS
jgi:hypothetical protein